ncbi:MAG TPA: YggT family protein [Candidatus Saccharimonadales bacterium]|nr:YggT family protein [Candidatus Saccharimonadales bacterium]
MDEYERTTRQVRIDEAIEPAAPIVAATPVLEPVAPGMAATPVVAAPAAAARIVTERESTIYRPSGLEMARRLIALAFGILQALIVLRIILLLLVANRDNGVVQFILGVTGPFVSPFRDMFSLTHVGASNGSVLDIGAIVALIAWTLIEALVLAILSLGSRRSRTVVY